MILVILVTTSVDSYIEFESDKDYSKDDLRQITEYALDKYGENVLERDNLKPTVYYSVASGRTYHFAINDEMSIQNNYNVLHCKDCKNFKPRHKSTFTNEMVGTCVLSTIGGLISESDYCSKGVKVDSEILDY